MKTIVITLALPLTFLTGSSVAAQTQNPGSPALQAIAISDARGAIQSESQCLNYNGRPVLIRDSLGRLVLACHFRNFVDFANAAADIRDRDSRRR